jgi:uncharacterized membrane protein YqjE
MADEIRIEPVPDAAPVEPPGLVRDGEASLGVLFRQLAEDSRTLIRQEVALAKVELKENARSVAKGAVAIGLGVGMLIVGLLVLTAFLVLGLGVLLGGQYWLSSLIVGGLLAVIGAIALLSGRKGLASDELKPEQTVQTIRENRDWARNEADKIKRDLTT